MADWGGTSGYFADPDGHPWEIAHNPGFPIDAGRARPHPLTAAAIRDRGGHQRTVTRTAPADNGASRRKASL